MTFLFSDSFDPYGSIGDLLLGRWSTVNNTNMSILSGTNTAFNVGQAVRFANSTPFLIYNAFVTGNEATLYASIRVRNSNATLSFQGIGLQFRDGANAQCTVRWNGDGSIQAMSGAIGGTSLGSTPNAYVQNTWDSYQVKVVIHNTAGSVEIRKNGSTTPLLLLTNVNTRAGSTNNFANGIMIGISNLINFDIDDVWLNNDDGIAPAGWPGDIRLFWSPVGSGVSSQFSTSPASYAQTGNNAGTVTGNQAANSDYWLSVTPTVTATLTALTASISAAVASGHFKMALYDNAGAGTSPGNILATSVELTALSVGTNVFSVAGGPILTKGAQYYVGFSTDTAVVHQAAGTANHYELSITYTLGFPSPVSGALFFSGFGGKAINFGVTMAPINWVMVSDATEDGDSTTVFDNVVGHKDVYGIQGLGAINPPILVGVSLVVFWKKSDSGGRGGTIGVNANASGDTAEINNITPSLTYTYTTKFMPTDPTGAGWTTATINAMQLSLSVAS